MVIFVQTLQLFMFTSQELGKKNYAVGSQQAIMHLPFANLGEKFQTDSFDAHRVETLCFQHTLARLLLNHYYPDYQLCHSTYH